MIYMYFVLNYNDDVCMGFLLYALFSCGSWHDDHSPDGGEGEQRSGAGEGPPGAGVPLQPAVLRG